MAQLIAPKTNSLRAFAIEMQNIYYGATVSDDTRLSLRQIEEFCKREAARVIKDLALRDLLLGLPIDESLYVTYPCLPIEISSDYNCTCEEDGGELKVIEMPSVLFVNGSYLIKYFGKPDFSDNYISSLTYRAADLSTKGTIGLKNKPAYWISGGKAYIILPKEYAFESSVTIVAVPADSTTKNPNCDNIWENEWTLPLHIKSIVEDRVLGKLLPTIYGFRANRQVRNENNEGNLVSNLQNQSNQV